jgi:hypothetical protein
VVWFGIGVVLSPIGIVLALTAPSARHRREPAPGRALPPMAAWSPPGWYPDPWRQALMRWYDGTHWTGYQYDPLSAPAPPTTAPRPVRPAVVSKRRALR